MHIVSRLCSSLADWIPFLPPPRRDDISFYCGAVSISHVLIRLFTVIKSVSSSGKRDAYVATLEQTVNGLEAVAQELKRSYEENCAEVQELKDKVALLQHQLQEQGTFWRQMQYDNDMQDILYVEH